MMIPSASLILFLKSATDFGGLSIVASGQNGVGA
jgi:hypothetical protein